ncbi:MAG: hypothetical protein EOP04_31980, partial [Proteobacteria bacterium]
MKTLVVYVYKEDASTLPNLQYFLDFGVSENAEVDYAIVVNDFACTAKFPACKNLRKISRANSFDLFAYREAVDSLGIDNYSKFIFLNSSCVGPFLPVYEHRRWDQVVTSSLSDRIKLVGPIAEFPPDNLGVTSLGKYKSIQPSDANVPFIHTYMFATDRAGLDILLTYGAFPNHAISKDEAIHVYERLVSSSILNEGFELKCFLKRYGSVDISDKKNWKATKWTPNVASCPEVPGNYDGIDVSPLELIFVKNLRGSHSHRSVAHSGISSVLGHYL